MTDEAIAEIYAIARESLAGGQKAFQFQAYPFRMTAENMAKYRQDRNIAFWRNLKEGSDRFEATGEEPQIVVAGGRYRFNVSPEGEALAARKTAEDERRYASLVGNTPAVRTAYADGSSHPSFQGLLTGERLEVSRPDALASASEDVPITVQSAQVRTARAPSTVSSGEPLGGTPAKPTVKAQTAPTRVAAARPAPAPSAAEERPFYARWFGNLFRS